MTNKERIERVEKEIGEDLGQLPGAVGMMLKSVILPQLKSVPDHAAQDMRKSVAHIIEVLKKAFDL